MNFQRGIPKKVRFVYDPQVSPRKDYIPTYEQFGWEYLGCMASAHIWRMEYEAERPQAFNDQDGLADRNRRNLVATSISFYIFLAAVIVLSLSVRFASESLSVGDRNQLFFAAIFFGAIALALAYFLLQMWKTDSGKSLH
jgi:magnesium-transporting ATPase (P-type)